MGTFKKKLKNIKAFVFDVDGVFSHEHVYLHPDGDMMRSMNIKDGFAIQYAVKLDYIIGIITGGFSESVKTRFNHLGVSDVYLKSVDKMDDFNDFMEKNNLSNDEVLYMGDDLPDYEVMTSVGLPTCPANAAEEIKAVSEYISDKNGGDGCVRDIVEQVLRAQGKWPEFNENKEFIPAV